MSLTMTRIMFMHEFRVIDSAESVEKLRMRLRQDELEQYGEAFIPEFVYEIIRRLPRFSSMRVSILAHKSIAQCTKRTTARAPAGCRGVLRILARGDA